MRLLVYLSTATDLRWLAAASLLLLAGGVRGAGQAAAAPERTPAGFCYPTGSGASARDPRWAGWLARDAESGGTYRAGRYHLGKDIPAAGPKDGRPGADVFALAEGELVFFQTDVTGRGGMGAGNSALFIEHLLEDGRRFLAAYIHVVPTLVLDPKEPSRRVRVEAGQRIATVGAYTPPHLHFGVYTGERIPPPTDLAKGRERGWGSMNALFWGPDLAKPLDTNGFVDPIAWIEDPENEPAPYVAAAKAPPARGAPARP